MSIQLAVMSLLSEDPKFKFVIARFPGSTSHYTYKTALEFAEGDFAVVETVQGFKVVEVVEVIDYVDVELNETIQYKWIVQKIDTTHYDHVRKVEGEITKVLRAKQRAHLRRQATEALLGDDANDVAKLVRL